MKNRVCGILIIMDNGPNNENNEKEPLLSICIPTYNRQTKLQKCLAAIFGQDGLKDVEIIISDNASEDETESLCLELAKKHSEVFYFRQKENVGPDRNFDFCMQKARGRYLMLLGDDDLLMPGTVRLLLENIQKFLGTGLFYIGPYASSASPQAFSGHEIGTAFRKIGIWWTFLSAFLINKESLELARTKNDFSNYYDTFLFQTFVFFSVLRTNNSIVVLPWDFIHANPNGIPSTYNVFQVFVVAWEKALLFGGKQTANWWDRRCTFEDTLRTFLPSWIIRIRLDNHEKPKGKRQGPSMRAIFVLLRSFWGCLVDIPLLIAPYRFLKFCLNRRKKVRNS